MAEIPGILKRLRGQPKKRKFATFDIESLGLDKPYAIGFYDGTTYQDWTDYTYSGRCIDLFFRYALTPQYAGYWLYAHNGGNFDFVFLVRRLLEPEFRDRYIVDMVPVGSTFVTIKVTEFQPGEHRKKDCKIKYGQSCRGCAPKLYRPEGRDRGTKRLEWSFLDSARLFPVTLKKLAATFGVKTQKMAVDMSYWDLAQPENEKIARRYMKDDHLALYQCVDRMQREMNGIGGQLQVTLPSTSLDLFRRAYQRDDIHINRHYQECDEFNKDPDIESVRLERCSGCMHAFAREAYFGGRTELYRMGFPKGGYKDDKGRRVTTAKLFDFNSHYPGVMRAPMPTGPAMVLENLTEEQVWENAEDETKRVGIVDCDVEIPTDCYLPPLPVERNGKLIFPAGQLRGKWDTSELKLLREIGGRIIRTRKSVWYTTSNLFGRFIERMYRFRQKDSPDWNEAMDFIAKIAMNSLYGKFAMREKRQKIVINPPSIEGLIPMVFDANVWIENTFVSPRYVIPQLSVHITALARAGLWRIAMDVLKAGGRIYYVDTDSLICSGVDLGSSTELGGLKLEDDILEAKFILPKLYLIVTKAEQKKKKREKNLKIRAKGVQGGFRALTVGQEDELDGQLSEKEFYAFTSGEPIERKRFAKLKESLRAYQREALEFPRTIDAPKTMQSEYDKRIILSDYDTKPLVLSLSDFPEPDA